MTLNAAVCVPIAPLVLALTLAGCGGSDEREPRSGAVALDQPIELADCTDWNEGSVEERLGTIRQIRSFVGGPVPGSGGGRGVVLPDDRAYELFENTCDEDVARGFTLYKIYARAAAFSGEGE